MKLSQVVKIIHRCKVYDLDLQVLESIIKNAPESDNKEIIKDIIVDGKRLAKEFKEFAGSNEYLQGINFAAEGKLNIANRRIKELEIELELYKKGI